MLLLNAETHSRRVYLSFLSFLAATSQAGALPVQSTFANCFISRAESVLVSCIFLFKWANAVPQSSNIQSLSRKTMSAFYFKVVVGKCSRRKWLQDCSEMVLCHLMVVLGPWFHLHLCSSPITASVTRELPVAQCEQLTQQEHQQGVCDMLLSSEREA